MEGQANGAEDETRTRNPQLGKLMLYQLSYFRPLCLDLAKFAEQSRPPRTESVEFELP